jgi:hypothetical protein
MATAAHTDLDAVPDPTPERSWKTPFKRIGILAAMALATLNVWTGSPLLGLWVGSRVAAGSGTTSLGAIGAVAATMGAVSYSLVRALAWLSDAYDRVTGRQKTMRRHVPWLRSMRGERVQYEHERVGVTPLEKILIATVVIAALVFEIWFFFYSGSSIDQRSGRS